MTRRAAVAAALLVITIMNRLRIIMTLTITVVNAITAATIVVNVIIASNVKAAVIAKAVPANAYLFVLRFVFRVVLRV
jgi:hypothetical protein